VIEKESPLRGYQKEAPLPLPLHHMLYLTSNLCLVSRVPPMVSSGGCADTGTGGYSSLSVTRRSAPITTLILQVLFFCPDVWSVCMEVVVVCLHLSRR